MRHCHCHHCHCCYHCHYQCHCCYYYRCGCFCWTLLRSCDSRSRPSDSHRRASSIRFFGRHCHICASIDPPSFDPLPIPTPIDRRVESPRERESAVLPPPPSSFPTRREWIVSMRRVPFGAYRRGDGRWGRRGTARIGPRGTPRTPCRRGCAGRAGRRAAAAAAAADDGGHFSATLLSIYVVYSYNGPDSLSLSLYLLVYSQSLCT
mmetsp:Transcript_54555/g.163001  ORF Transcript_54555/g.163001 Transcript_54555/m.163001 type:complete len:206 (-) Transcript_54555:125-742(-)